MWTVALTPDAQRQYDKQVSRSPLKTTVDKILAKLAVDPFAPGNKFKALRGKLTGFYSRRVDEVNRIVYTVDQGEVVVYVVSVWSHYGDS